MDDGIYILESEEDRIAHERALYRAFYHLYPGYAKRYCRVIGRNRLQPIVPYESQTIYGVKHAGMLIAAGSFCFDHSRTFLVERMGFTLQKTESTAEGLHLYSTIASSVVSVMDVYRKMLQFVFSDLRRRGITTVYASCSERPLKLYRLIGFTETGCIEIDGEREYLIRLDVPRFPDEAIFDSTRIMGAGAA